MHIRDYLHALPLALGLIVTGCGGDDKKPAAPDAAVVPVDAAPVAVTLSTAGTLGAHLVDSDGKSLYFFANDVAGSNATACTGACATTWPAFDVQAPTVGEGLTAADFGRFDRGAGVFQATWKGRPLYRFAAETAATPSAGEGTGGRWFVARAYNLFFAANAAVTPQGGAANAPFLTNGAGRSVYVFKNDVPAAGSTPPTFNCTAAPCTDAWALWEKPAALTTVVVPSTIPAADVAAFDSGGKLQFVYKGWPLYFFKADDAPGKVAGAAITNWGAVNIAWNGTFTP